MRATVAGATGFVGRALVKHLREHGSYVRPVSRSLGFDLRNPDEAYLATDDVDHVFNLAAQVGGIGFIEANDADCIFSSVINANLLRACAASRNPPRYFYASSSCVYPGGPYPMQEQQALPAMPHTGYGWDKIFSEQMCWAFEKDKNVPVVVARFHTLYGPGDSRPTGREHVIEALCKKFVVAKLSGTREIEIWGDGTQTRSFLYIDDCVEGILRMADVRGYVRHLPALNLAHPKPYSVNEIVDLLEEISGIHPLRHYQANAPTGILHKTSDNAALRAALNWEPPTLLPYGLEKTYRDLFDRALRNDVWQTSHLDTR